MGSVGTPPVRRIGVHLEALRPGAIGGLEHYVRHLLAAMRRHGVASAPLRGDDADLTFVLFCAEYNIETFGNVPDLEKHLLTAEEFSALDAEALAVYDLDLWFCPLLVLAPENPGLPSVVTIPDLQHEAFPEFFSPEILEWRRRHYRRTVERADRILTLSRYSKNQITSLLGADPEKVVVTHLDASPELSDAPSMFASRRAGGAQAEYLEEIRERHALPSPRRGASVESYFYYPGAAWPHKNHGVLFEALARLKERRGSAPRLVLTGARVESEVDLAAECRRHGLEDDVLLLGYVPAADLPGLYAMSLATVFPSLFEGFGIPVIEAMRSGSPVICSSAASLPEVGGDAAVYFDPRRPDELCDRLETFWLAVGDDEWVSAGRSLSDLVLAGRRQALKYSWQRTAEATLEVFHAALAEAPTPAPLRVAEVALPASEPAASPASAITIVTPSLNQCTFIERTIHSVLEQPYPGVRHLVIDGGSTDGTVEVLEQARERYPGRFDFVSEPDRGQAHAVNKGFERATRRSPAECDIVGWLNSDDMYEPGCFEAVAAAFRDHPDCDVLYGRAHYVDEDDHLLGVYPTHTEFHWQTLAHECFICQPTVFLRRRVLDRGFQLDEKLQMCMDYDFWIRLGKELEVRFLDQVVASSRMYRDNKTISRRSEVYREIFRTVKRHYGRLPFSWALGRAHHVWDHGDPFFNVRRLTWVTYLIAGGFLLRHNIAYPRYWPNVCREVWVPLAAKMKNRWRALQARDSAT